MFNKIKTLIKLHILMYKINSRLAKANNTKGFVEENSALIANLLSHKLECQTLINSTK